MVLETVLAIIQSCINELGLGSQNWKNNRWQDVWTHLDQETCDAAYAKSKSVSDLFSSVGPIEPRKLKNIDRVKQKMKEQNQGFENYFKVISDLIAFRISCSVPEISGKINEIQKITDANGGKLFIKGGTIHGSHKSNDGSIYTDITQYIYIFIPSIGFPIEMQIGHPFAAYTFTSDSYLRDNKNNEKGVVDLWKDKFYETVRNHILEKANSSPTHITSKENIIAMANKLHNSNVPDELLDILNKIS